MFSIQLQTETTNIEIFYLVWKSVEMKNKILFIRVVRMKWLLSEMVPTVIDTNQGTEGTDHLSLKFKKLTFFFEIQYASQKTLDEFWNYPLEQSEFMRSFLFPLQTLWLKKVIKFDRGTKICLLRVPKMQRPWSGCFTRIKVKTAFPGPLKYSREISISPSLDPVSMLYSEPSRFKITPNFMRISNPRESPREAEPTFDSTVKST